jgi:hypothetical protein
LILNESRIAGRESLPVVSQVKHTHTHTNIQFKERENTRKFKESKEDERKQLTLYKLFARDKVSGRRAHTDLVYKVGRRRS